MFAALAGVSPIPASSGKTHGHRLNRAGDRQANAALHRIVLVRLSHKHPATMDYMARRTAERLSKRDISRCLKRYVAREVFHALQHPEPTVAFDALRPVRLAAGLTLKAVADYFHRPIHAIARIERRTVCGTILARRHHAWPDMLQAA